MKILFFPPANLELLPLFLDYIKLMKQLGVQVILFEENYFQLIKMLKEIRFHLEQQKPDIVLGFDNYFLDVIIDKGIIHKPVFEELGVPYFSILTYAFFRLVPHIRSHIKMMDSLLGFGVMDDGYKLFVEQQLGKDCFVLDYSFPERGAAQTGERKVLVGAPDTVKGSNSFEDSFISDYTRQIYEGVKKKTPIAFSSIYQDIDEDLFSSVTGAFILGQIYSECFLDNMSFTDVLEKRMGLEIVNRMSVRSINEAIDSLSKYLAVFSYYDIFSSTGMDKFSWFALRIGNVPMARRYGIWKELDINTFENEDELISLAETLSDRKKKREIYTALYEMAREKFDFESRLLAFIDWVNERIR